MKQWALAVTSRIFRSDEWILPDLPTLNLIFSNIGLITTVALDRLLSLQRYNRVKLSVTDVGADAESNRCGGLRTINPIRIHSLIGIYKVVYHLRLKNLLPTHLQPSPFLPKFTHISVSLASLVENLSIFRLNR
jgi:hypothetical protein